MKTLFIWSIAGMFVTFIITGFTARYIHDYTDIEVNGEFLNYETPIEFDNLIKIRGQIEIDKFEIFQDDKTVYTKIYPNESNFNVDVESYKAGIYVLRLNDSLYQPIKKLKKIRTFRMIKP